VDDLIRHLGFVDDVVQNRLRVGIGQLAFQDAGHHFDTRQRIFHFVRNRGRHLAERDQPIAQPFTLFNLLDFRQVLEEDDDADRLPPLVAHMRQRVADHLAGRLQPELGAIGQMMQLERAVKHAHHIGVLRQHFAEVAPHRARGSPDLKNSAGLGVDFGHQPVARDRKHAVAHARDEVAEKAVSLAASRRTPGRLAH
jgi:hypothetical protein